MKLPWFMTRAWDNFRPFHCSSTFCSLYCSLFSIRAISRGIEQRSISPGGIIQVDKVYSRDSKILSKLRKSRENSLLFSAWIPTFFRGKRITSQITNFHNVGFVYSGYVPMSFELLQYSLRVRILNHICYLKQDQFRCVVSGYKHGICVLQNKLWEKNVIGKKDWCCSYVAISWR